MAFVGRDPQEKPRCPVAVGNGGDCWNEPHPASRHFLCLDHWVDSIEDWVGDCPLVVRICPKCRTSNMLDPVYWAVARCYRCGTHMDDPGVILDRREREKKVVTKTTVHDPVVYYVQLGSLVKIGTSTNLRSRMQVVPHEKILAIEPGGLKVEQQRHREFAKHLVDGQREWFQAVPELLEHAKKIVATHGNPDSFG